MLLNLIVTACNYIGLLEKRKAATKPEGDYRKLGGVADNGAQTGIVRDSRGRGSRASQSRVGGDRARGARAQGKADVAGAAVSCPLAPLGEGRGKHEPLPSLILVTRRPLLQEGIDTFVEEARARTQDLTTVFHRDDGIEARRVDRQIQAFLGQTQTER